jgi:hypothetical protein
MTIALFQTMAAWQPEPFQIIKKANSFLIEHAIQGRQILI